MYDGNQPTPSVVQPNPYLTPNQPPVPVQRLGGVAHTDNKKTFNSNLIKTLALILTSLISVVFIVLFIWMYVQWNESSTDVESQINTAVAEAEYELRSKLEEEFAEQEKYPYKTFVGPSDFGLLTFEYPKTWSLYIPDDGSTAQNYHAYLNPDHVNVVDDETVMALRVSILNTLTERVLEDYNDDVEDGEKTHESRVVNGINVDVYTGLLDSDLYGIVCVFKIRDKTVVLQTDAYVFSDDFYRVLDTVRYNA